MYRKKIVRTMVPLSRMYPKYRVWFRQWYIKTLELTGKLVHHEDLSMNNTHRMRQDDEIQVSQSRIKHRCEPRLNEGLVADCLARPVTVSCI